MYGFLMDIYLSNGITTEVFHSVRTLWMDEICPDLLKALDLFFFRAVLVDTPLQHFVDMGDCVFGLVPLFKIGD